MERYTGDNPAPGDGDCWAIGYKGDFYVATFDDVPDSYQWKFTLSASTLISSCDTSTGLQICTCTSSNNDIFDVSCEISSGRLITTMKLVRPLQNSNSGVVIRNMAISGPFLSQQIIVSG